MPVGPLKKNTAKVPNLRKVQYSICNMMKKESGDDWGNFLLHHLSYREKLDSSHLFLRPLFKVVWFCVCKIVAFTQTALKCAK